MLKPLLAFVALLAVCSVPEERPVHPPDQPEDQSFCCTSVTIDKQGKLAHGEGCVREQEADECPTLLHCPGPYAFRDGVVTCRL